MHAVLAQARQLPCNADACCAGAGKAHTLDSEAPTGVAPAEVTSAAKQEAVNAGSAKSLSAVPTPLYAGGPPPSMMTSPVPQFSGPSSPTDTAAYVHVRPRLSWRCARPCMPSSP